MNPIELIQADRLEARKLQDPNADICFLALASKKGKASVRTLVVRELKERTLRLFINSTSPKWHLLEQGAQFEVLLWYGSRQKQFRLQGETSMVEPEEVKTNWFRRPRGSKYLDYVYKTLGAQSSEIPTRQDLVEEINRIKSENTLDDMTPPDEATGVELIIDQVEMLDLNREDRIHDRRLFSFEKDKWHEKILIP